MLRLKANKTSLYKLVERYTDLPGVRKAEFTKAPRFPDYWLKWNQADGHASAFLSVSMGRPLLAVEVHDDDGHRVFRTVHTLKLADLQERGMVEKFVTAAERRRNSMTAEGADNGGMAPAT